jgi:DNA-binding transcriptional regulator GbsR (MarR family)
MNSSSKPSFEKALKILTEGGAANEPTAQAIIMAQRATMEANNRRFLLVFVVAFVFFAAGIATTYFAVTRADAYQQSEEAFKARLQEAIATSKTDYNQQLQAFSNVLKAQEALAVRIESAAQRAERSSTDIEAQSRALVAASAKLDAAVDQLRRVQATQPANQ